MIRNKDASRPSMLAHYDTVVFGLSHLLKDSIERPLFRCRFEVFCKEAINRNIIFQTSTAVTSLVGVARPSS